MAIYGNKVIGISLHKKYKSRRSTHISPDHTFFACKASPIITRDLQINVLICRLDGTKDLAVANDEAKMEGTLPMRTPALRGL
jgi:hypothetical protein